ncbi:MAG: hypothetical protein ABSF00_01795 [Candidatus Bathyarchaeia archaeon]
MHKKGQESTRPSINHYLKGNVMLTRKAVLRPYESCTVSLMLEFALNESDHVTESQKLMNLIDQIVGMAKEKWGPETRLAFR